MKKIAILLIIALLSFLLCSCQLYDVTKTILDKNKVCLKCSKCSQLMRAGTVAGCPIRDSEAYVPYYQKYVLGK